MASIPAERLGRLLHRQQGFAAPHHADVESACRAMVGAPGANPWGYLALLPRVRRFSVPLLEDALYEDRTVVRLASMRGDVHVLTKDFVPFVYGALRGIALNQSRALLDHGKIPREEYERAKPEIVHALGTQPMTVVELSRAVGRVGPEAEALSAILSAMCAEGILIRTITKGGWQSNLHAYARWGDWMSGVDPKGADFNVARKKLADAYIRGFGPATVADFAHWSGLPLGGAEEAFEALDFPTFEVEGAGELTGTARQRLNLTSVEPPYEGTPALLPANDPFLHAFANPDRILPSGMAPYVIDADGNSAPVIVVDGRVVGLWGFEAGKRRVVVRVCPFANAPENMGRAVEASITRLADFLGVRELNVERYALPQPLDAQGPMAYLAPLKNEKPVGMG